MAVIVDLLKTCSAVKSLVLSDNHLTEQSLALLCDGLDNLKPTLKKFYIRNCQIAYFENSFVKILKKYKYLEVIDLSNHNIYFTKPFFDALKSLSNLRELSLENCNITQCYGEQLGKALKDSKLTVLKIGMNPALKLSFICIIRSIQHSAESFQELSFDLKNIRTNHYSAVLDFLSRCKNLVDLTLTCEANTLDTSRDLYQMLRKTIKNVSPECEINQVTWGK